MTLKRHCFTLTIALVALMSIATTPADANGSLEALKGRIFALAESFQGEGDPDFRRQRELNQLVDQLLKLAPQPPVAERLGLLRGPWRQVWGPYDYRSDGARGIDPRTDPNRIYQVVFPGGFYYNVAPQDVRERGPAQAFTLLRGTYRTVDGAPDMLRVRFTALRRTTASSNTPDIWRFAGDVEGGTRPATAVLPGLAVRLFFGGGYLREVYTNRTMRITYGGRRLEDRSDEFIYIMRRAD